MKLHRNRKKNNIRKLISLALACCMTLSMGSSYANAGEMGTAVESSAAVQESREAESVPAAMTEADNQDVNHQDVPSDESQEQPADTGETPSGADQDSQSPDDQTPVDGTTVDGTADSAVQPSQTPAAPEGEPNGSQDAENQPSDGENPPAQDVEDSVPQPSEEEEQQEPGSESGVSVDGMPADETPADGSQAQDGRLPGTETGEGESQDGTELPGGEDDLSVQDSLAAVPEDAAGAAMSLRGLGGGNASDSQYGFDAYYVNQYDPYNVTLDQNFNLKYQMEFHASQDYEPGEVVIRIAAGLFVDRNGNSILPTEIGVPQGSPEEAVSNRSTPFNYYYEDRFLVFFNYKKIDSGTNAAWQVLYKDQKLMDITDGTKWTLRPQISVDEGATYQEGTPLSGQIDSAVFIESVTKSYYTESGLNYTPGLYTLSQVTRYISGDVDNRFLNSDGRLNTTDWRYVVWDVKVKGTATQPWDMVITDIPGSGGQVVGYKDNSDRSTAYKLPIGQVGEDGTALRDQREESWGNRFYVVTAYPAQAAEDGTPVQNDITIRLIPRDGQDAPTEGFSGTATWTYKNYDWSYSGNIIGVHKETDKTVYTGWLDAYRLSKVNGADYGDMPFTTTGHMYGYSYTHRTDSSSGYTVGDYIPGTYYTLTTVDDFMYLYAAADDGAIMDGNDYYFSAVNITQTDYGYDVWEDQKVESELTKVDAALLPEALKEGGNVRSRARIYAMLAAPNEANQRSADPQGWVLIDTVDVDASGSMSYAFSDEVIAQQPWRVKVEHDTIDYETICKIDVKVRIKSSSSKMAEILGLRNNAETNEKSPEVKFENVSGVMGTVHLADGNVVYFTNTDGNSGSTNYGEPGLAEATKALYQDNKGEGILLVRDNAYRTVTWLNETAASFKKAGSTNDVDNNRVLVDYYLTAYDGYEIYDRSSLNYLREEDQDLISPGRSHVVFYDLLPYGMQFDASYPITAGRITDLSRDVYQTQPKSWDSAQVTVTVNPEKDIITNYRGTGRTMVVFHIAFDGADATSYTNGKWIEGWGVSFRAYYEWKDMDQLNQVKINANLSAFMPDFSEAAGGSNDSHPALVGLKTEVDYDNGTHGDGQEDLSTVDKAYADMVREYADENGNLVKGNIDGYNPVDKDGNPYDTTYRNVLYAKNELKDDVATASQSTIEKLVRADSDRFGTFDRTATVPAGSQADGFYTYDINVTTATGIKDIAVFDRLERAAVDRKGSKDPFAPFEENTWSGTFQSLDTTGLDKRQIPYTVYYNRQEDAAITTGNETPESILTTGNGWYEEAAFEGMLQETLGDQYSGRWQDYVKAVAVKLDPGYKLEANHSISFRIRMKAPMAGELEEGSSLSTYNNASFSSVSTTDETRSTVTGNSVKVTVSAEETLEVIKETSGPVPGARQDENFEFRLYKEYTYDNDTEKQYLAYTEYKLYKFEDGQWKPQEGLYATDGNGYLYLHAGEKAVFEAADAGRIRVKETENIFWESETKEEVTEDPDSGKTVHSVTVTNTYRPVLYMQKKLSAVPEGMDVSGESFTFRIEVKKNNNYFPLANAEFWYVNSIRLDGGAPEKLKSGLTDDQGKFTLREGEIIALFPGAVGTEYRITEIGSGDNWICEDDTITGATITGGSSKSITNYYKWKELLLTKDITHQTQEDYDAAPQPFTFCISEVGTDAEGKEILTPAAGKEWVLLDKDGNEITGTSDNNQPGSGVGGEANPTSGTLDQDGKFTCNMGFRTVKIKDLEAGKTYRIVELTEGISAEDGKPLYVPADGGSATAQMPVYSTRKNVTITNDYQKRPLSVTKTVVKTQENGFPTDQWTVYFRFTATVNGTNLPKGTPYTVTRRGGDETVTRYVGSLYGMDSDQILLAGGSLIDTLEDNEFILADGETAVFKDAGMLEDAIIVSEVDNVNQIYPADKGAYTDTLSGDGSEASFVNGEKGSLLIGKEYVGLDEVGSKAVEELRFGGGLMPSGEDGTVEFVLRITDSEGTYVWPEIPTTVNCIDREGNIYPKTYEPGDSISVTPWETIVIPTGEGTSIPSDAQYTLIETEESRKRIIQYCFEEWIDDRVSQMDYWLQISQSAASDVLAEMKTVSERPSAVICNEVSSIGKRGEGSIQGKRMTSESDEVPTGKKLVWRLERYDRGSGAWLPASKIPYLIFRNTGFGPEPVSREVETTKEDGRITLYKLEGDNYPQVWFPKDRVYLNLYRQSDIDKLLESLENGKDLLRLVEVPEESDAEWGMLVGYDEIISLEDNGDIGMTPQTNLTEEEAPTLLKQSVQEWHGTEEEDNYPTVGGSGTRYNMDVPPEKTCAFVNSNTRTSVEIEKYMKGSSDALFTMVLEQVISTSLGKGETITKDNYKDAIAATRPGAGIPYTVYNADGSAAGSGVTDSGGELKLEAGQYARLEVPDSTMWTVSEKTSASPNYRLTDLQPESGDVRLTKLNENLMLIHLPAKVIPKMYKVEWYSAWNGELLKSETRSGNVGEIVVVTEEDKQYGADEGYRFSRKNWNNIEGGMLNMQTETVLKLYFDQEVKYTVEWYDIEGERLRESETRVGLAGQTAYPSPDDKKLNGYKFDEGNQGNIKETELSPDKQNVLRLYFRKIVDAKIKVTREYYLYGEKVAGFNVTEEFEGVEGDVITAESLSQENTDWNKYSVDGKTFEFRLSNSNHRIQLEAEETEYAITLKYEYKVYEVRYTDGTDGSIFGAQSHNCWEGERTPEFNDGKEPTRTGYKFAGWQPVFNPYVSGGDAVYSEEEKKWIIEYQATWEKK